MEKTIDHKMEDLFEKIMQKHKERLTYNADYQRDLRKIKKLGLNCTVAEYRKKKETGK